MTTFDLYKGYLLIDNEINDLNSLDQTSITYKQDLKFILDIILLKKDFFLEEFIKLKNIDDFIKEFYNLRLLVDLICKINSILKNTNESRKPTVIPNNKSRESTRVHTVIPSIPSEYIINHRGHTVIPSIPRESTVK